MPDRPETGVLMLTIPAPLGLALRSRERRWSVPVSQEHLEARAWAAGVGQKAIKLQYTGSTPMRGAPSQAVRG
jgi:hypothetical protein